MVSKFLLHFSALASDLKLTFSEDLSEDEQDIVHLIFTKGKDELSDIIIAIYEGDYVEYNVSLVEAVKESFESTLDCFGDSSLLTPFMDFEKIAPLLENEYFFCENGKVIQYLRG